MFDQKFNSTLHHTTRSDFRNNHIVLQTNEDQKFIDKMYAPKTKKECPANRFHKETYIIKSGELGCHECQGKNGYSRNHGGLFYIR